MKLSLQIILYLFINTSLFIPPALASVEMSVTVSSDDEISITRYPAEGKYLILWFAPEYGFRKPHRSLAQALSNKKLEVWQSNIIESLFMKRR